MCLKLLELSMKFQLNMTLLFVVLILRFIVKLRLPQNETSIEQMSSAHFFGTNYVALGPVYVGQISMFLIDVTFKLNYARCKRRCKPE